MQEMIEVVICFGEHCSCHSYKGKESAALKRRMCTNRIVSSSKTWKGQLWKVKIELDSYVRGKSGAGGDKKLECFFAPLSLCKRSNLWNCAFIIECVSTHLPVGKPTLSSLQVVDVCLAGDKLIGKKFEVRNTQLFLIIMHCQIAMSITFDPPNSATPVYTDPICAGMGVGQKKKDKQGANSVLTHCQCADTVPEFLLKNRFNFWNWSEKKG